MDERALVDDIAEKLAELGWTCDREVVGYLPPFQSEANPRRRIDLYLTPPKSWAWYGAFPRIGVEAKDEGGMRQRRNGLYQCMSAMQMFDMRRKGNGPKQWLPRIHTCLLVTRSAWERGPPVDGPPSGRHAHEDAAFREWERLLWNHGCAWLYTWRGRPCFRTNLYALNQKVIWMDET